MCSSSITSVHIACQNIRTGECDIAIAGGVNVSIHPNKYLMLAQGKFASSTGKCESFGDGIPLAAQLVLLCIEGGVTL